MKFEDFKDHIDKRFDKLEDKVDNYQERITRVEERTNSMRGHIKTAFLFILGLVSSAITYFIKQFIGQH